MTNQRKHGTKPIKYIDVCEECYRMEKQIDHIEARGSKFCARRTLWSSPVMRADADILLDQCPMTGAGGIKCSMKKKTAELRCSFR